MTFMKKFRGIEIIYDEDDEEEENKRRIVRTISIHPDETHLAYVLTSEIIFADFHGNKIRNMPGIDLFSAYIIILGVALSVNSSKLKSNFAKLNDQYIFA
jgi:hypothetical protein